MSVAAIKVYPDAVIDCESHKAVEVTEYRPVLLAVQGDDPAQIRIDDTKH